MTDDISPIGMYLGKKVEDLTREEMLECIKHLARENNTLRAEVINVSSFYTGIIKGTSRYHA